MELIIDEKGRKVIDVPFLNLERNPNWTGDKEMPYLKPADEFILPKEIEEDKAVENDKPENMYLCTENEGEEENPADGEEDPEAKKRKLHFGGLNLKKKKSEAVKAEDNFASAPDTFDEWWPFKFFRINHCTALFDCDPVVMFQGLDSYNRSQWQKEPRRSVSLVNTEPVTVLPWEKSSRKWKFPNTRNTNHPSVVPPLSREPVSFESLVYHERFITFLAVGIWHCSRTNKKVAGGAWEPHTQNYAVVAMGIRRLRENVEN